MPDGGLADLDRAGIAWAERMLDHVQPDTILTFGPDGETYHPDHIAVYRWVTRAWEERGCRSRLLYSTASVENIEAFRDLREQWNVYMTADRPTGVPPEQLAVHVRLDGLQLDRKLAALRAMATQIGDVVAAMGPELFAALLAEECFIDAARNPDFDSASRTITTAT
jgi:LmbE family N-acetylglucosaminyl deacetylase